jgi:ATP-binding cassette subfamily B protein
LTLLAMIYVMFRINVELSLIAMAISPVLFLFSEQYKRQMRPKYRVVKKMESGVLKIVQEVIISFRLVKAFGREDMEGERYINQSDKTLRQKIKLAFFEGAFSAGINLTTAIGTAAVFYFGVRNVLAGVITLGELLMVIAYLSQLYGPLQNVSKQIASLQSAFASADRVFELMDEAPDVIDKPNAKQLERAKGQIEYNNVAFSYDGKNNVLKNINFKVNQGARVGIAGKTGAGKTTLVSLLPRFYDVTNGQILLDGIDIRDYRIVDLRNQFSIVLQEPVLFSTSIDENIRYAKPEATEKEVISAAKAANAHDFIESLPEGYETLVGERGMLLSGGERQRISLARAFLKDAPILILDEPTSSVDTKTEGLIMSAMERLMKGRTTFIIAHRLSTLDNCDLKIEMDNGKIQNTKHEDYSDARLLMDKQWIASNQ